MASLEEVAAVDRRRDRSYSDAHHLIYCDSTTTSSRNTPDIKMDSDTINKSSNASLIKTTCAKKHHSQHHHHHHHHHHGNRPRSKSLDLTRHCSTTHHKKKYPHQHKHIPRTHSPGVHHAGIRVGPSSPTIFKGKMWIRPAATVAASSHHRLLFPALANVAPSSPSSKEYRQLEDNNEGLFKDVRQQEVTDGSLLPSPTSFDDEMMTMYPLSPKSSLDSAAYQGQQRHDPPRIIFGESGKPIKPRSAFEHYTPTNTAAYL